MKTCQMQSCGRAVVAHGLCNKHYHKLKKYGDASAGYEERSPKGAGSIRADGYRRRYIAKKEKLEHILIVESVLSKPLPKGTYIHHIDGNPQNNSNSNLLVCPSQSYHKLIHQRQAALDATGHSDWRTCNRCHQYDAPENLYISANHSTVHHRSCEAEYKRTLRSAIQFNQGATP